MIAHFQHVCIDKDSDNKVIADVEPHEFEYGMKCDNCGEPLATTEQIIAHIYRELLE